MRILLICEFFPVGKNLKFSGGVEARTFYIAKYLATARSKSKKHKVIVIAARTRGAPKVEKMFNFTVYRIGSKRDYTATTGQLISRLEYIRAAVEFGNSLDVDIVDGANFIAHFIAKRISKNRDIPVVAWYPDVWLGSWIKNTGLLGLFGEILERLNLVWGFDGYITISKQTAQKLKNRVKGEINIIGCGVEEKEFSTKFKKFQNPTVLCVSRLTKYKNIKTLIFAFAHLNTRLPTSRLIIVGSGPEEKNLKNLAKSLNISSKVQFLANLARSQLIGLYKSSHIFCLPSLVEGFGIANIEAAAAGLPYVNSDIPIQKEVTKNGQGGYLVEPYEPFAFSEKFYRLINNQSLYRKKSKEARRLSHSYQWSEISRKTESVYSAILQEYKG